MNHQRPNLSSLIGTLAMLFAVCLAQAFAQSSGGGYTIRKSAVAGGGGASANGTIQISGTAGQSATRTVSDGTNTIAAGFWTGGTCTFTASGSVITPAALPNGIVGQSYSQTLTGNGSVGPYAFTVTAGALPNGLSLNESGVLSGTPSATGTANFTVIVTDGSGCTAPQNFSLTVVCPTITLSALPNASAGTAYSASVTAAPAGGNYSFTLAGTLPPGLSFNNGGFSGTPAVAGVYGFTVTATGFGSCTGSQSYNLTVTCPTIALSPATLTSGQVGVGYSQIVTAQPAGGTYSYAVTSGALPNGLALGSSGQISGTPTQTGTFNFRITATGFGACAGFRDYQIIIGCSTITVSPTSLPDGMIGTAYNQNVSATPAGTYSYSVSNGALPTGLTLNGSTGSLTGTPVVTGSFSFTVTATAGNCSGARGYTMTIGCQAISFTTASLPAGNAGVAYSQTLGVTPAGSYFFSLTAGSLPSGLTLNSSTGVLSGLPTVTGAFNFTIKALAANGCFGTQAYSLAINCPVVALSPASLPNGTTGTAYSQTLSATPAGGGYTFTVTSGSLPTGLTLNPATGVLSGTPTASSSFTFTVTATGTGGFGGCAGSQAYTVVISGGNCPAITLPELPNGSVGQLYNQSVAATPAGSYSYTVTSGAMPPGVTLYGSFGLLYGYPTSAGSFDFTIQAGNNSGCTASKSYTVIVTGGSLQALTVNDFSGDRRSDFVLWRAAQGQWLIVDGATDQPQTAQWGQAGDVAVPGDYDGDGKADLAVFGKDGHWRIRLSSDGTTLDKVWGLGTDVPVPGDYDGDGRTDPAVWRGAESTWHILRSSDNQVETVFWGTSNAPYRDLPVAADYDGDGRTDIAVFRQANGHWYIRQSLDGATVDKHWGMGTDLPVPGDFDGDGKTDIAVWRVAERAWYILQSSDGETRSAVWKASYAPHFDELVVGDYDGDGKADFAVWRKADGRWYIMQSSDGRTRVVVQGKPDDKVVMGTPYR
jgi:hypothetical protein